ncbi:MAG TPA: crotonase/enoyl-CoA hydratase family protein [Acidimicrobiaceae bacterium]|nr:crotonase/enoyl-CoA hydratase family protein [Acidimicrobiaceae bacterium]
MDTSKDRIPVTLADCDGVAVVSIDDGKANALNHQLLEALSGALEEASNADAVVIAGRPGRFSAGFDLEIMNRGGIDARDLLAAGVDVFLKAYMHPRPVVVSCSGHAIAAGAIILMSSDIRIGAHGDFKLGMPELTIGMPLPFFATELMRDRLSTRHLGAALLGEMYGPAEAVEVGFLDDVVAANIVLESATERARALAPISRGALQRTRLTSRGAVANAIRAGLVEDLSHFDVAP